MHLLIDVLNVLGDCFLAASFEGKKLFLSVGFVAGYVALKYWQFTLPWIAFGIMFAVYLHFSHRKQGPQSLIATKSAT